MTTSKVGGSSDLLATIRTQVSRRADRLGGADAVADEQAKLASEATSNAPFDLSELRRRLGKELSSIDVSVPSNRKLARRAFIESVMCWDLGDSLLNSPEFGIVVTEVETSIAQDSDASARLDELIQQLGAR